MILKEAGASFIWQSVGGKGLSGGQHQAGTCRMGNDPQTSVTDKYGRVHDTSNVFVADASLHVNNGGFNPALTILALDIGWPNTLLPSGKKETDLFK